MDGATSGQVASGASANTCAGCGTTFPLRVLSCPTCHRLVHAERLRELSAEAAAHAGAGRREAELSAWRGALELLPPESRQYAQISAKIDALLAAAPPTPHAPEHSGVGRAGALGGLGLLLWKFKWLLAAVLTKGKLLLLGLTKMSTLFSMLVSLGVYWSLWGWQFALGFVLSMYVHEMGHVMAFRRLGIAATAPMFIPGFGAFIRGKQYPKSAAENAQVGLAGPIWGLGAALACFAASVVLDSPLLAALAHTGALLNLFNLVPLFGLDGSHGFGALDRKQRWMAAGVIAGAWFFSAESLLLLLLIPAGLRAMGKDAPQVGHRPTLATYAVLVAALAALTHVPVDTGAGDVASQIEESR